MSASESPTGGSLHQRPSRDLSAYQDFLGSDLDDVRKQRNGGRTPFGLLFELPPPPSFDCLGPVSVPAMRSGRKRKSDERSPARASGPSTPSSRSLLAVGKERLWEIYKDVDGSGLESTSSGSVSGKGKKKSLEGQVQKLKQQEEWVADERNENEDIHRLRQPIEWLTDRPRSKVLGEPVEALKGTVEVFETITEGRSTLKAHVLDSRVHSSGPLAPRGHKRM